MLGVAISELPCVSLTTGRSLSELRCSVNSPAPGAVQQHPGARHEMRWMSNSVWFTDLLSGRLQGDVARMLEGFWDACWGLLCA